MEKLQLGVGRALITPEVGCKLMGYRQDFYSDSLHDDLTATAFWFRQGNTEAVMVNLTVCNVSAHLRNQIAEMAEERFGIAAGAVLLSSTHTHSGPFTASPNYPKDWGVMDPAYIEGIFIPGVLEAIAKAKDAIRPVTVGIGKGESRIGVNRRQITPENKVILGQNPWGSFDPTMTVLSFKDENGETYANMVHYGCHNTAAGRHPAISRDWAGILVDRMELLTGGITAFFNGTAGDTGPRLSNGFTTGRGNYDYVHEQGNAAARDAMQIWNSIRTWKNVPLKTANCTIDLPLQPRESLEEVQRQIEIVPEGGSATRRAHERHYADLLASYQIDYEEKTACSFPSRIIRIGEAVFYGLPFEPFSGLALRIRDYTDVPHPLCLGYTDGSEGYFPTVDQIPVGGYEVNMLRYKHLQSYVDHADFHLITDTVENLKKVYD